MIMSGKEGREERRKSNRKRKKRRGVVGREGGYRTVRRPERRGQTPKTRLRRKKREI